MASRKSSASQTQAELIGGVLRLTVTVEAWRFVLAVDVGAANGVLRDVADTVAAITGVDRERAMTAIDAAVAALPVPAPHRPVAPRRAAA